jgi:hypothetical protein
MASSLDNPAWVDWMTTLMGEASRQSYASTLPPDRYYCLLDELPLHLLPQHAVHSLRVRDDQYQPVYLNPECILCAAGQLPDEFASSMELLSGFALQGNMAWVRNPSTGSLLPFWIGPEVDGALRDLRWNEPVPSSVRRRMRSLLTAADILLSEGQIDQRRHKSEEGLQKASETFRKQGYAPVGALIHPFHIAALRRYYRYLIRTGAIRLGDGQSPRRYVAYNEPVARFFHRDIAATLAAVAGESLKPSYVYLASYLSGAELKRHTDRAQCEFSVTLCLDFSPEPSLATPWPIRLDVPTGTVTVYQALGDGLAYRGTRLPHYRDPLGERQTSTSIFFHYVSSDFAGSLD